MKSRVVINIVLVIGVLSAGALAGLYLVSTRNQAPAKGRFRANIRAFLRRSLASLGRNQMLNGRMPDPMC